MSKAQSKSMSYIRINTSNHELCILFLFKHRKRTFFVSPLFAIFVDSLWVHSKKSKIDIRIGCEIQVADHIKSKPAIGLKT